MKGRRTRPRLVGEVILDPADRRISLPPMDTAQLRAVKAALLPQEAAAHYLSKDPNARDLTRRKAAYASRLCLLTINQINAALAALKVRS